MLLQDCLAVEEDAEGMMESFYGEFGAGIVEGLLAYGVRRDGEGFCGGRFGVAG